MTARILVLVATILLLGFAPDQVAVRIVLLASVSGCFDVKEGLNKKEHTSGYDYAATSRASHASSEDRQLTSSSVGRW